MIQVDQSDIQIGWCKVSVMWSTTGSHVLWNAHWMHIEHVHNSAFCAFQFWLALSQQVDQHKPLNLLMYEVLLMVQIRSVRVLKSWNRSQVGMHGTAAISSENCRCTSRSPSHSDYNADTYLTVSKLCKSVGMYWRQKQRPMLQKPASTIQHARPAIAAWVCRCLS